MRKPRQRAKLTRDERAVLSAFARSVKASVKGIVATSRSARKVVEPEQAGEGLYTEQGAFPDGRRGRLWARRGPRAGR